MVEVQILQAQATDMRDGKTAPPDAIGRVMQACDEKHGGALVFAVRNGTIHAILPTGAVVYRIQILGI